MIGYLPGHAAGLFMRSRTSSCPGRRANRVFLIFHRKLQDILQKCNRTNSLAELHWIQERDIRKISTFLVLFSKLLDTVRNYTDHKDPSSVFVQKEGYDPC